MVAYFGVCWSWLFIFFCLWLYPCVCLSAHPHGQVMYSFYFSSRVHTLCTELDLSVWSCRLGCEKEKEYVLLLSEQEKCQTFHCYKNSEVEHLGWAVFLISLKKIKWRYIHFLKGCFKISTYSLFPSHMSGGGDGGGLLANLNWCIISIDLRQQFLWVNCFTEKCHSVPSQLQLRSGWVAEQVCCKALSGL